MNQLPQNTPDKQNNSVPLDQDAMQPMPRTAPSEKLSKFLIRISNEIESLDREKRLTLFRKQIKAYQFFDGNFYGYVNESGEWISVSNSENREYQDNQYYPYIRTALMELSRRQTEVTIKAAYSSEQMDTVAKFAQERYNDNRDKTFNAHLKQTENSYAVLGGIIYRYTYFDFSGGGRREKIPRLMPRDTGETGTHGAMCANCLEPRSERDEVCPQCQSDAVLMANDEPDTVIGYDDIPTGKNVWVSPNPVGIIVSMQASTLEESPFLKWKQLILRSVLEEKYKGVKLPSTGTISPELRYIGNQQIATPSGGEESFSNDSKLDADDTGRETELLEHQQHWLDYPLYCNKTFDTDERMSDGTTLPAGTPLGKRYPNGLYFTRVGDLITDMWNEDKNDKWTSSPYSLRAGSMYGAGTFTAHSDQELLNDLTVLQMSNAWNNAVAREFVDPELIKELSADPAKVTEVAGMSDGQNIIGRAYGQAPPLPLSGEIYAMGETAKGAMQNKIGALSGGAAGLADAQKWGDTATAISIKRDLAVGRFAPDLELMADNLDRKQAIQFLKNEQRFFTPEQWKRVQGDYNEQAVKGFLECDIERDLVITIVPGSYMPKSDSQTLSRLSNYAQIAPVLMQMGNPELLAYAGEVFGIPKHLGGWDTDRAAASSLLSRLKQLSEMFIEQYGDLPSSDLNDPQTAEAADLVNEYAKMPVDVFLDNHQGMMDALKDWRGRDEGRTASNILLAAAAMRFVKHQSAIAQQGAMMQKLEMEAMAPMQEQAAAEQQAQMDAQAADAEKQQVMEIAGKAAEMGETEAQREHEAAENAADRERDVLTAAITSEGKATNSA